MSEHRAHDASELPTFAVFFEHLGLGAAIADEGGIILRANTLFCALTGFSEEELRGQPISDLAPQDPDGTARVRHRDGSATAARVKVRALPASGGGPAFLAVLVESRPDVPAHEDLDGSLDADDFDSGIALLRFVYDAHGEPIDLEVVDANSAWTRSPGFARAVGSDAGDPPPGPAPGWLASCRRAERTGRRVLFLPEPGDAGARRRGVTLRPAGPGRILAVVHEAGSRALTRRPAGLLEEGGLIAAFSWLAERVRERYGLSIDAAIDSSAPEPPPESRPPLFDLVEQALLDIVRHETERKARLRIERDEPDGLRVVVEDRGSGRRPARDPEDEAIRLARHRLALVGGSMGVRSTPGSGTRVEFLVPLGAHTRRTILLVDDHEVVRQGLRALLENEPDLEVVGEAADGSEGLALIPVLPPDLLLMDLSMPGMDGVEATRRICRRWPELPVIGLSMHEQSEREEAMLRAGAVAYLPKTDASRRLLQLIRTCA